MSKTLTALVCKCIVILMLIVVSTLESHALLIDSENIVGVERVAEFNTNQIDSCLSYDKTSINDGDCREGEVSIHTALWLFVVILGTFVGLSNKKL